MNGVNKANQEYRVVISGYRHGRPADYLRNANGSIRAFASKAEAQAESRNLNTAEKGSLLYRAMPKGARF